jgi:hypothetical protein
MKNGRGISLSDKGDKETTMKIINKVEEQYHRIRTT